MSKGLMAQCENHGWTTFVIEKKANRYIQRRCLACRRENASRHHRKIKKVLVEEHGGHCIQCGYNRCIAALHFHHRDPTSKTFAIRQAKSLTRARIEAAKCDLLCANCHAEIENQ